MRPVTHRGARRRHGTIGDAHVRDNWVKVRALIDGITAATANGGGQPWQQSLAARCAQVRAAVDFAELYFKRGYQPHLAQSHSNRPAQCAAQCINCALNDQGCGHAHSVLCPDCQVAWIPAVFLAAVQQQATDESVQKQASYLLDDFQRYIVHLARERWTRHVRDCIIKGMAADEAIITIDWAMKWLPFKILETQREWFGQRGMSWHSASVIRSTDGGKTFTITYINLIMRRDSQTWYEVLQCIQQILTIIHVEQPDVKTVKFFADNAGCYSGNGLYANLRDIGAPFGIHVAGLFHSEAQAGKTEVDAHLGAKKRAVRLQVITGKRNNPEAALGSHDAATPQQLYDRLCEVSGPGEYVGLVDVPIAGDNVDIANRGNIPNVSKIEAIVFARDGSVTTHEAAFMGPTSNYTAAQWKAFTPPPGQLWTAAGMTTLSSVEWKPTDAAMPAARPFKAGRCDPDPRAAVAAAPAAAAPAPPAAAVPPANVAARVDVPQAPARGPLVVQPVSHPRAGAAAALDAAEALNALAQPAPVVGPPVLVAPPPAAAGVPAVPPGVAAVAAEPEPKQRKKRMSSSDPRPPPSPPRVGNLLPCTVKGCMSGPFTSHRRLQQHIEADNHRVPISRRDLTLTRAREVLDKPVAEELMIYPSARAKLDAMRDKAILKAALPGEWMVQRLASFKPGWGRPKGNRATRKTQRVIEFLQDLFDEGLKTTTTKKGRVQKSRKVSPKEAEERMRADGRFEEHEILDAPRIAQHFSQLSSKKKKVDAAEADKRSSLRQAVALCAAERNE